jgi:hypothetical protein
VLGARGTFKPRADNSGGNNCTLHRFGGTLKLRRPVERFAPTLKMIATLAGNRG